MDERIAQRFALVYAAGCLAARYGVLPYSRAEISAAVRYCHGHVSREASVAAPQATLASAKTQGGSRRLLRRVAKNVARHRRAMVDLRRRKPTPSELRRAAGFTNTRPDGERELLFTPAKFREVVCGDAAEKDVIDALKREGLIHLHQGGKTTIPRNLPDPLGRTRVVCLKSLVERLATSKE
jgi:hypothetical protein